MSLYMFRALNVHLQEDTLCVHAAYGTVTLYESSWWSVGAHANCAPTGHHEISQRVTVPYDACIQCILLKMRI